MSFNKMRTNIFNSEHDNTKLVINQSHVQEAASKPETTTEKKVSSTTEVVRQVCKPGSCNKDQECDDSDGVVRCHCRKGFRNQGGTCKGKNVVNGVHYYTTLYPKVGKENCFNRSFPIE